MSTTPDGYNLFVLKTNNLSFANPEPKSSAWPGETGALRAYGQNANKAHGITKTATLNTPPSRSDFGFISGVVTRKGVSAPGQRVVCLDDRFNLISETISGSDGSYRFDSLRRDILYTVIAQDNWDFKYAPVGADRRTPEAYS